MKNIIIALLALTLTGSTYAANDAADKWQQQSAGVWKDISPEEIDGNFVADLENGLLLTTGSKGRPVNAMTIGWGGMGMLWRRPVITVYVSGSRYTHSLMEQNDHFTVCRFDSAHHDKLIYMGTHSGRDTDKIGGSGLTLRYTESGHPYYEEANLMIECRLMYKAVIDPKQAPEDTGHMYEKSLPHTMFIGEIVSVKRKKQTTVSP